MPHEWPLFFLPLRLPAVHRQKKNESDADVL